MPSKPEAAWPEVGWPTDRIGRVVRAVNLHNVRMIRCLASAGLPGQKPSLEAYDSYWTIESFVEGQAVSAEAESVDVSGGLSVAITFLFINQNENPIPIEGAAETTLDDRFFWIAGSFELRYAHREGAGGALTGADVHAFADFNATFNAWPYWREFVQSTATRFGMDPVTIPALLVPDLTRQPTEADT